MGSNVNLSHLSKEELLEEIATRDDMISNLKQEIQKYRQLFHSRKIAVSAEVDSKSPRSKIVQKDQKLV